MNLLYGMNYAIFAVFFMLFILEIGIALGFLFAYKKKDQMKRYLMPIWEVTGTFAVFYLVNFETTYPTAISLVGNIYIAPLLIAAIFFIFRNAFIAYSEYVGNITSEKTYLRIYSVATIITAFLVISVLSSGISGFGVNVTYATSNFLTLLFNPFNILIFVSVLLFAIFAVSVFFEIESMKRIGFLCAFLGILITAFALYSYTYYAIKNEVFLWHSLVILFVLLISTMYMSIRKQKLAKYVALAWLFDAITYFGTLVYPFWFGTKTSPDNYLVNSVTGHYAALATAFGGLFLLIALAYFLYIIYVKKGKKY